jgi:hypothetical protein
MLESSWVTAQLTASQEGLNSKSETVIAYWIPNNNEIRPTDKVGSDNTIIFCLGSYCAYRYTPDRTTHADVRRIYGDALHSL